MAPEDHGLPVVAAVSVLSVCLCGVSASDLTDGKHGWRLCRTHNNAVKLESLNGMNVMLYEERDGEIVPVDWGRA